MSECIAPFACSNGSSSSVCVPEWPVVVQRLVAGSYAMRPPLTSSASTPSSGCARTKSASPSSAPPGPAITQSTEWYTTNWSGSCSRNPS